MAGNERFDDSIGAWLEESAPTRLPGRVLDATFERTRGTRQDSAWRTVPGRPQVPRLIPVLGSATAVLFIAVAAFSLYVNQPRIGNDPSPTLAATGPATAQPSHDRLSSCIDSFQAVTGTAPTLAFRPGEPADGVLGCSRDGTRLLIQKGFENLFVLHADGSETQVTEQLSGFSEILGSGRPAGATMSPDGSRVVFAGLTKTLGEARSCHDGALFAVDADGGPAELLWKSQVPQNGIVKFPTFSPDGTQIAFADGYCDQDHSVWVMNADGTDAHKIVAEETTGAAFVDGLAWSPAGDRIALLGRFVTGTRSVEGHTYSFAIDGSALADADWSEFCWPGRQCSAGIP